MNIYKLSSYSPLLWRFAIMLFAIAPITYLKPWLAIIVSILMVLCFTMTFILSYMMYRKDKAAGLRSFAGDPRDQYYDCMIAVIGLIVYNTMNAHLMSLIWILILISGVLKIIATNKNNLR